MARFSGDSEESVFKRFAPLLMIVLVSACATAQSEKPIEAYLSTGAAFPTHDFDVRYDVGFNGSVGLGFKVAPKLRVVTKLEIQTFALGQSAVLDFVSGGDYASLMAGIDLRFFKDIPRWSLDPLLLVGGGIAYSSESQLTIGSAVYDARTETKPYFNVGVGVDVRLTPRISAFVVGRYVQISTSGTKAEFFPITIGIRYPI